MPSNEQSNVKDPNDGKDREAHGHRAARVVMNGEEAGVLYWYDDAGTRQEAADALPDLRSNAL